MKLKVPNSKIKIREFFSLFLCLNIFCKGIGLGNNSLVYFAVLMFGLALVGVKFMQGQYSTKEMAISCFTIAAGFISMLVTHKPTLLITCITIVGMKNVNLDVELNKALSIRWVAFFIVISLSLLGIIDNLQVDMWRNGGFENRFSLGFEHPNTLHLSLFLAVCMYVFCKKKKISKMNLLILGLLNVFIFSYSKSRTGFVLTFLLLFLSIAEPVFKRVFSKSFYKLPILCFLVCIIISFGVSYMYNGNPILTVLNNVLNNRIAYANYYLTHYSISLFGYSDVMQDINAISDNSYTLQYIQYGIVGLLLWVAAMYASYKELRNRRNYYETSVALVMTLYMLTEGFGVNAFMNFILLFAGAALFERRGKV